jgi:hypothetical protein
LPLESLIEMLGTRGDRLLNAAEILKKRGDLEKVPASTWVRLLQSRMNGALRPALLELLEQPGVDLSGLTPKDLLELVCSNWQPVAWFGWNQLLLRYHQNPKEFEHASWKLLDLLRCPHGPLRQVMVGWLRETFAAGGVPAGWVYTFFQSIYADAREVAWEWFRADPVLRVDEHLWGWLVRHQDPGLRQRFLDFLEDFQNGQPRSLSEHRPLDEHTLAVLRARVLLTIHRGWGQFGRLVDQLRSRLEEERPDEAESLLCLLAEILRGPRGRIGGPWSGNPSQRLALAAVVQYVARHPDMQPVLAWELPGLQLLAPDRAAGQSVS